MKVRTLVSSILPKAFKRQSNAAVAKRLGKSAKTIARWLKKKTSADYEALLADPIIGPRFRELLCIHDHDAEFPSVGGAR